MTETTTSEAEFREISTDSPVSDAESFVKAG
jgi:hypothetical protein